MQQRYPDRPKVGDETRFGQVLRISTISDNHESLVVQFDQGEALWVPEDVWRDILVSVPQLAWSNPCLGWLLTDAQAGAFFTRSALSWKQAQDIETTLLPKLDVNDPLAPVVAELLRARINAMRARRATV
ncbi:MAG: hypothetical protein H6830_04450 [Planctomycetes bacterium]|nr:hypothetical protein [Planctomycetota bacterium]MCB9910486.1 hypothetical protein [Planctomycetota bacterium]MCB9912612.1 hypothetical protein [Planctomycetota bacterium]